MNFFPRVARWRPDSWVVLAGPLAAVFSGLIIGTISPIVALGLVIGALGAAVLLVRPDWAWVITLLLVAQAIPGTLIPEIPMGFAKVKMYELTFLAGLMGSAVVTLKRPEVARMPLVKDARNASLLLVLAILGSAFYSRFYLGNHELVLAEARPYLALSAFAAVATIGAVRPSVRLFDGAMITAGTVLSAIVIVQMLTGLRILDARVEDLGLSANTGITRSVTDTGTIVQAYAIYRLAALCLKRQLGIASRLLFAVALAITVVGLLGTFTRGAWIATAAGALVAAYVSGGLARVMRVAVSGSVLLALVLLLIFLIRPNVAEAMVDRAMSVSSELEHGASYGWRRLEDQQAWDSIQRRPILGVALGGAYKNEVKMEAGFLNDQYFIHNGYLYFPLKMGIPGLLVGLWIFSRLVRLMLCHSRGNPLHAAQAGVAAVILMTNISGPVLSKFLTLFVLMSFLGLRAAEAPPLDLRNTP